MNVFIAALPPASRGLYIATMKIVFMGSGAFGLPTLRSLCEKHDVALVVTQPDRPAGRKRVMKATPIGQWASEAGLDVIKPDKCNATEIIERIKAAEADANVVVAYGQKVGDELISSPRLGRIATVNLHASLLPKYRGAAPINWAMVEGEDFTGNTVFSLVEKMDAGDMLGQQRTPIDPGETAGELHDRLSEMGPELVLDVLGQLESGDAKPQVQDESQVTIARKLSRADAVVDFAASAETVRRRIHGLTPWPGVTVRYGADRASLKVLRVEEVRGAATPQAAKAPGVMIGDGVIECGEGVLRLVEVQMPGKKPIPWVDFQRGQRLPVGTAFDGGA